MAQVAVDAWHFAYQGILAPEFIQSIADLDKFTDNIQKSMMRPAHRLVAVSDKDTIVGFANERRPCKLEGYDSEIGGLYVAPSVSRFGIGSSLVIAMVHRFIADGHGSMAIHTLAENKIGSRFYEKIGGTNGPTATWEGVPSKWYVWDDLRRFV